MAGNGLDLSSAYHCDGGCLGVAVLDRFGALAVQPVLEGLPNHGDTFYVAVEAGDGGLFVGRVRADGVGGTVGCVLGLLGVFVVPGSRVVLLYGDWLFHY